MADKDDAVEPQKVTAQANFADDDKKEKDDDKSENMEDGEDDGGLDVAAICKAIESGEITVADMDAILAAIQAQGGAATEEEAPAEEVAAPAAAPGEAMKADTGDAIKMAALQGEVAGLKAKDRERDEAQARDVDVAEAHERLKDRAMGADLKGELMGFHKEHGPKAFKAYVDNFAKTFGKLPMGDKGSRPDGQVPAVAMKYQDGGPDAIDMAAKLADTWQQLQGTGFSVPLERFVNNGMKKARA